MTAEPLFATRRSARETLGGDAAKVAVMLGIELDGWQRRVLDVGLELVDGVPGFRDVTVTTPRQQGKSVLMFVLSVYGLLSLDRELILYGAQQRQDARTRLVEEWWPAIQRSELADRFELARGAGFECLFS